MNRWLRHWRQTAGLKRMQEASEILASLPSDAPLDSFTLDLVRDTQWKRDHMAWKTNPFVNTSDVSVPQKEFDPVQSIVLWIREQFSDRIDVPHWLSPVMNALDLDYRLRMNKKIEVLEAQVGGLKIRARDMGLIPKDVEEDGSKT